MSCVEITEEMAGLLERMRSWPLPAADIEELRALPVWDQARAWGWIMASGELTGTGARHAGDLPKGILPRSH